MTLCNAADNLISACFHSHSSATEVTTHPTYIQRAQDKISFSHLVIKSVWLFQKVAKNVHRHDKLYTYIYIYIQKSTLCNLKSQSHTISLSSLFEETFFAVGIHMDKVCTCTRHSQQYTKYSRLTLSNMHCLCLQINNLWLEEEENSFHKLYNNFKLNPVHSRSQSCGWCEAHFTTFNPSMTSNFSHILIVQIFRLGSGVYKGPTMIICMSNRPFFSGVNPNWFLAVWLFLPNAT